MASEVEWAGLVNAAGQEYVKTVIDLTVRNRLAMAMLMERGKINTGIPWGEGQVLFVEYRDPTVSGFGYGQGAVFQPQNFMKKAYPRIRGCHSTDAMHYDEYYKCLHATNGIRDRYKQVIPKHTKAVQDKIGLQIYADGNLATNDNQFDGMETYMDVATGGDAPVVGDLIAMPDGSYQGLATDLGQSGTWTADLASPPSSKLSSDWPHGSGDPDYDYNSPLLVNWSSNAWGTSAVTWESNCLNALSQTGDWLRKNAGATKSTLLCMLEGQLMQGFRRALGAKNYRLEPWPEAQQMGFSDTFNYEGIGVKTEFGVPANTGYVLDMDSDDVSLNFTTNDMIETEGPAKDLHSASYLWLVFSFGNYRFVPKRSAKLYNYAAA